MVSFALLKARVIHIQYSLLDFVFVVQPLTRRGCYD